jgi:hypothetical protein
LNHFLNKVFNKMNKIKNWLAILALAAVVFFPAESSAKLGVGVATGKIEFDKPLKPGGLYTLPSLTVINTGDEAAEYGVSVEYKGDQPRMSPPKEWFIFTPSEFHLEAGQSQVVQIQANLPIKTVPGDYFAYLQGFPVRKSDSPGGATIGIAAASKLYFTVAPANIFQGIYYRLLFLITTNTPWSYVILAVIGMAILVVLFRRYFSFNIGIKKKGAE